MPASQQRRLRVHLIAGARPNFVKIAPLWRALKGTDWCDPVIVHTGQHYDLNMSDWMFRDLGLPAPDHHLGALTGSHARVTGSVMMAYETLCLEKERPDWVIVVGDVDSTIACAMVAKKLGLLVAHLEAGLRSFDRAMPEELNRVLTDSIADLLWTPSPDADENLAREGIPAERVECVGNIMIDALVYIEPAVNSCDLVHELGFELPPHYCVVTLHRPSNVDHPQILNEVSNRLRNIARDIAVVFPVHPRTAKSLQRSGLHQALAASGIMIVPPLSYLPFIALIKGAAFLLTDSGGIQEEASYLGIPCLTLRSSTERPVTISLGTNRLVNLDTVEIAAREVMNRQRRRVKIPLWDGETGFRVTASLKQASLKSGLFD